jgi:ferrous iron transport protein B
VGNPNTGKTSLFNALTGFRRHIANYPGVTVEAARGPLRGAQRSIELIDLPGTYSLAALAPDELLVVNLACGRIAGQPRPDAILAVVDASNLPRNLYLLSQVLELGLPTVVALNMIDVAGARGIQINHGLLSERLGVPVVPVVATRESGVRPLREVLERAVGGGAAEPRHAVLPELLYSECEGLKDGLPGGLTRAEALRVLLDREGEAEAQYLARGGSRERLVAARERLRAAGLDSQGVEVRARYAWIARILEGVIQRPEQPVITWSDRLDRVLTHKFAGGLVLGLVLLVLFQSIFTWSAPLMDAIDGAFAALGGSVAALLPPGALSSLIADGLIAGVGGVLVFLPQILLLFAFIAVLEDCGYMARAAYMMDRVMRVAGLSGRAFIPLLSSFACAVPAIMGTRTIADRRERFVTILIAPFMSCSARLPVYVLLISTFVPPTGYLGGWISLQTLVMMGMYLVGVVAAVPIAWLLRRTVLAGAGGGFILELPSYKLPRPRAIWQRMYLAGRDFLVRAGTLILVVNLVVWALGYFPRSAHTRAALEARAAAEAWDEARQESELAGAYLRDSYLGRMGRAIEPLIRPIGWDWRVGMAVIASFPAREVVIATLGTIFNLGAGADEQSESLRSAIRSATWPDSRQPIFTLPVALSIMVFFALCAQCASTLVVIGRETGSWLWPLASFVGMTTLAYLAAWGTAAAARAMGL